MPNCWNASKRHALRMSIGAAVLIAVAGSHPAQADGEEKCEKSDTEDCRPTLQLEDSRLDKTLKTLPRELSPVIKSDLPDLIVLIVGYGGDVQPGETVQLRLTIRNIGTRAAGFESGERGGQTPPVLQLFRSEPGQAFGELLADNSEDGGTDAIEPELLLVLHDPVSIRAGETATEDYSLAMPEDAKQGAHRICAIADPENAVRERNEDNNRSCRNLYVRTTPEGAAVLDGEEMIRLPSGVILKREELKRLPDARKPEPDRKEDK